MTRSVSGWRVVPALPGAADREVDPELDGQVSEITAGVLAARGRVEDHRTSRAAGAERCPRHVGDEPGSQVAGGGPAEHAAGCDAGDGGRVGSALVGCDVGDVAAPAAVGPDRVDAEVAHDQVGRVGACGRGLWCGDVVCGAGRPVRPAASAGPPCGARMSRPAAGGRRRSARSLRRPVPPGDLGCRAGPGRTSGRVRRGGGRAVSGRARDGRVGGERHSTRWTTAPCQLRVASGGGRCGRPSRHEALHRAMVSPRGVRTGWGAVRHRTAPHPRRTTK